jgi:hypothetical protein
MTEELLARLDALAAKLGVAAGQLWEIMVRQVYVEVVRNGFLVVLSVGVFVWTIYFFTAFRKKLYGDALEVSTSLTVIFAVLAVVVFSMSAYGIAGRLINPEFYALDTLMKSLPKLR